MSDIVYYEWYKEKERKKALHELFKEELERYEKQEEIVITVGKITSVGWSTT